MPETIKSVSVRINRVGFNLGAVTCTTSLLAEGSISGEEPSGSIANILAANWLSLQRGYAGQARAWRR